MRLENCCPAQQQRDEIIPESTFLTSGRGKWSLLAFAMNSEMAGKPLSVFTGTKAGQLCGYFWM